jgi:hypothetical protein
MEYQIEYQMEEKKCDTCQIIQPVIQPVCMFEKYTDRENSYSKKCNKCSNELDKKRKINLRRKKIESSIFKCEKCNEEKAFKHFSKLKKFYKKKICLSCYPTFLTEQKTEWSKNQSKVNVNYRLKKSLAAKLRTVLVKNDSTMNYIGCNIQYFREWFEYNFTPEMNWDNYGSYWSIGHIIPICKFDLTNNDEKMKCWNWSNMMPVSVKYDSSKKEIDMNRIDMNRIDNILKKIEKFKEEGSTTKWFSGEYLLNMDLVQLKIQNNSS